MHSFGDPRPLHSDIRHESPGTGLYNMLRQLSKQLKSPLGNARTAYKGHFSNRGECWGYRSTTEAPGAWQVWNTFISVGDNNSKQRITMEKMRLRHDVTLDACDYENLWLQVESRERRVSKWNFHKSGKYIILRVQFQCASLFSELSDLEQLASLLCTWLSSFYNNIDLQWSLIS